MLHCILGKCLPIQHVWTSRRAHDQRKMNFWIMTSEVTHLWACDKIFLESEFQHVENKPTKKKENLQQNLAVFAAATDSEFFFMLPCRMHFMIKYRSSWNKLLFLSVIGILTLKAPNKNCSRCHFNFFYFYLLKKIKLDFSCESSA